LRVLVTYYSETGNTEKVAKAIYGESLKENEAYLRQLKDISADALNNYDLVFLGSACHSSDLAAPVKKLLGELPGSPRFKLAVFFTHSVWAPEQNELGQYYFDKWAAKCIDSFENTCREKHIDFKGCYHCQGSPSPQIEEFIRSAITRSRQEWDEYIREARKHPVQGDLDRAKSFAREVISMCVPTRASPVKGVQTI